MSYLINLICVSILAMAVIVGGAYILYLKKKEPIAFQLLQLRFHWWRASVIDIKLIRLAKFLERILGIEDDK